MRVVTGAFNQRRQFGEHPRRVAFDGRRLADSQRDLTLCHGVARQGVHDQQHMLAAIAEIFGDARGVGRTLHTQQRRDVRRRGDNHRTRAAFSAENVFNKVF